MGVHGGSPYDMPLTWKPVGCRLAQLGSSLRKPWTTSHFHLLDDVGTKAIIKVRRFGNIVQPSVDLANSALQQAQANDLKSKSAQ